MEHSLSLDERSSVSGVGVALLTAAGSSAHDDIALASAGLTPLPAASADEPPADRWQSEVGVALRVTVW